jgi:hypothetical protein
MTQTETVDHVKGHTIWGMVNKDPKLGAQVQKPKQKK